MRARLGRIGSLLLLVAVLAHPGAAQADPACQQAADRLPMAKDSANYPTLVITLAACGSAFAQPLANEWLMPPADTLSLRALSIASTRARSPEMFEAIKRVIADQKAELPIRLAAIEATTGWVNPCMTIRLHGTARRMNARYTATTSIRAACDQGYGPTGPHSDEAEQLIDLLERVRRSPGGLAAGSAAMATATALEVLGKHTP